MDGVFGSLPLRAFSPKLGNGPFAYGMTLHKGGNVFEDIGGAISDAGQSVANVVSDVGTSIDNAVIQPAIDDPAGTVVKIGAIVAAPATGGTSLYAIPAYTASKAIAAGVPIEDVAKMTAISAAATAAGVSVADYVGTLAEFGTDIGSQQTAMLAAQNVGIGTGGAASTAVGQVAGGAVGGAVGSGLAGGDIGTGILSGAVNAGIGAGVGAAVDTGAGLLSGTNTGNTNMDEFFGPTYSELGYDPGMGPTYQELGYTGPNYADLGYSDQAAADAAWAQAQAEFNAAGGYSGSYSPEGYGTATGTGLGNAQEIANFTGEVAASGLPASTITNLIKQYGTQAAKALISAGGSTLSNAVSGAARRAQLKAQGYTPAQINAMEGATGLLGAGANYFLNQNQLGQLRDVYSQNVAAQQAATQTAQQQASFKPVGMTTAFGQSQFQFDPTTGQLTSAGYTPTSQVAGQVQNLFGLGAQALPTTADTQAIQQQYIAQQQGLLAPGREQQLAQLRNRQYQRGTTGLATGGTMAGYAPNAQGLMATNPEMAAYYNSLAQQEAALAANAPTYAQNLLNQQIATGTGLFGAANTLEQYAQQPLSLSASLGTSGATAGAKAGYYGLLGNQSALATQLQGQLANVYGQGAALGSAVNPLVSAAGQGLGSAIGSWLS